VNGGDLGALQANTKDGACVRTLRYQRDFMSPGVRHGAIGEALPERDSVEIRTWNPFDHPVLGDGVGAAPGSPLAEALRDTVTFLRIKLAVASPMEDAHVSP
jgi:hypothetical protein